jgi:hypothetical protein
MVHPRLGRRAVTQLVAAQTGSPDPAVMRLARALAKDAARQDHERQVETNETCGDIRPVLDRPPRR